MSALFEQREIYYLRMTKIIRICVGQNISRPSRKQLALLHVIGCVLALSTPAQAVDLAAVRHQLDIGEAALMRDPATSIAIARAQVKSLKAGASFVRQNMLLAEAHWLLGAALTATGDPDRALIEVNLGLDDPFVKDQSTSKLVGDLYSARAVALMAKLRVEEALPALQKAYAIYTAAAQPRSQALALLNIGSIYIVARDYAQALRYYQDAITRLPSDNALLVAAHGNRGQAFLQMGNGAAAQREFSNALARATVLGNVLLQQQCLRSLAYAQLLSADLDGARRSLRRGYALTSASGDQRSSLDWVAAKLALRQGDIGDAVRLIKEAFQNGGFNTVSVEQRDALQAAYEIYKAAGDDAKALTFLEAFKQADDKARSLAASASAALMSARFDFVNQQAQIKQLHVTQEAQAAAAREKLRTTIFYAALVAAFVILALMLAAFISIRRSRDQVRAANDDLSQSNSALEKALAARTEFLAMTSHEIRTPLNGILGMTQVLLADRALETGVRGKIELVHGAGETMKSLVDDLLDVAKMATGEIPIHKAEMELGRLLHDAGQVWQGQARARGIDLAMEVDVPARIVEDEVRLRQIVFNLMSNAIKFTDHGTVALTATAMPGEAGERLLITVRDSGIGIPADKLEEIFESFRQVDAGVTRRHGGTGLGLAICRSLARAMGGDVTVTSIPGAGSTFALDLPLQRAAEPIALPARAELATSLAEAVLLVVEANPISQSVLRSVLGGHVAGIHLAANAGDAARLLAAERIDVVLADAATLGLDLAAGDALAAEARQYGAQTALLWPQPDDGLHAAAAALGIARVIGKPIGAADLVVALQSLYTGAAREHLAA